MCSFLLYYYILLGKKIGGNTNWKKVFSVFFHANVPTIPMSVVLSILMFLMMDSFASIDPSSIMESDIDEEQVLSMMGPVLAYGLDYVRHYHDCICSVDFCRVS